MTKFGSFEDVETVMDRMMQVPVFGVLEKREMCRNDHFGHSILDPNLVMDARHKFSQKPVLIINNNQITVKSQPEVDLNEIRKAREEHLLQLELRRFEKSLQNARPKFHQNKTCTRNTIADSSDDDFWLGAIPKFMCQSPLVDEKPENSSPETVTDISLKESSNVSSTNIKVTIKDKPAATESIRENNNLLRKVFYALKENVKEKKRCRDLCLKMKERLADRLLRRSLESWKKYVQNAKDAAQKKKEESEMTHERKIEMFVNAIAKKQEELARIQRSNSKDGRAKSAPEVLTRPTVLVRQVCVVESPAQNRLKAQQKIIEEQRLKLDNQRRIIEDMQLKEFQNDSRKISTKTLETAKEVLEYCGPTTRRILRQLMREKANGLKTEDKPLRVPSPPEFLLRMEARAEARKERVRKTREEREKRQEEEKQRQELQRKKEEDERRELQLEAQREAKRIRKEQEQRKIQQLERQRQLNEQTDRFYQHYLLKRFFLHPFRTLLQQKQEKELMAIQHHNHSLLRRSLSIWTEFTRDQQNSKVSLVVSFYNHKLLVNWITRWKEAVEESKRNLQVACDFYDMKIQSRMLKMLKLHVAEEKAVRLEREEMAVMHYKRKLLRASLECWKRFVEIADELRESERRKEEMRALVQKVLPDFDPKNRGVAID